MMVFSFGSAPAQAVAATDEGAASSAWGALVYEGGRVFAPISGEFPNIAPVGFADGPVEVVVQLKGRSLAAEQVHRLDRGLPAMTPVAQRVHVEDLRAAQAPVEDSLRAAGATILYRYQIVLNGIAAVVDRSALPEVAALPGVVRVARTVQVEPALDNSVPFILGGQTHAQLGTDGTGVTIAIVDTGIDYTHAALGGSGNVADYTGNDPTIIESGTFPTAKVVGGTDLVGEWYSAGCPAVPPTPGVCSSIPMPDPDPLDRQGHGSHVAGIAAGVGSASVPVGVAPGASLLAVKVFALGSTSSAVIAAALEYSADPNGDGDTSDMADVLNMSLGGPFGRDTELGAVASNAAAAVGIVVVASAGNSGDILYITGSPAAASRAISVAAGNDPGIKVQLTTVAGSVGGAADGGYESIEAAFTPPLTTTGTKSGPTEFVGIACSAFPSGSLTGKIPLIARGTCRFDAKVLNVQNAGAIAAVVYNNVAGAGPITMGGNPIVSIPAVMVGNANGLHVRANIGPSTTITLDPANQLPIPDRLQGFTSRGPRFGDSALKPDITAPGGAVLSVAVGSGTGGASFSGTSMAAPHVAGASALLRALYPDWTVEEVKAVLMGTATNASPGGGVPYPLSLMGAGRVRVDVAANSESVVLPASMSFGVLERDKKGVKDFEMELEVRNMGTEKKEFSLSFAFLFPADDEGSVAAKFPARLKVSAGDEKKFTFHLRVDFDKLMPESSFEEYDAFLTLTETTAGADVLRVPVHVIPYARARADAKDNDVHLKKGNQLEFRNKGLRSTSVDIFQFGASDKNEDLIDELRHMPKDPDDWFDIRRTGARAFDAGTLGRLIEFAVVTEGRRSVANLMMTNVYLDVDGGGADYLVQVADLGLFSSPSFFDGRMASAIFHIPSGAGSLQFLIADSRNTALQMPLVRMATLNALAAASGGPPINAADPDFEYWVETVDLETGSSDASKAATFNVLAPGLDASPQSFLLSAGATAAVTVTGNEKGRLLVLYSNNVAGHDQSELVKVKP